MKDILFLIEDIKNSQRRQGGNFVLKIKYLVNVVSLMYFGRQKETFPGNLFAPPEELIEMALNAGYGGVQGLPIRGLTGEEKGILLYEDAWNPISSLWSALRHLPGAEGMPSQWQDWLVSPKPEVCSQVSGILEARGTAKVVHQFDGNPKHVLEVNSRIDMPPLELEARCREAGQFLCIDTLHFIEYCERYSGSVASIDAEVLAHELLHEKWTDLIKVIHFHEAQDPDRDVAVKDQIGNPTALVSELIATMKRTVPTVDLSIVAEYKPTLSRMRSKSLTEELARVMRVRMQKATKPT